MHARTILRLLNTNQHKHTGEEEYKSQGCAMLGSMPPGITKEHREKKNM
jgi:hypothetical protein